MGLIYNSTRAKARSDICVLRKNRVYSAYPNYLNRQKRGENVRLLSNVQEDYKRVIAVKAAEILNPESWTEVEIGEGDIGDRAIKAVQRNRNLIGRFQVSGFADKVKEDIFVSERFLYNLYHDCRRGWKISYEI